LSFASGQELKRLPERRWSAFRVFHGSRIAAVEQVEELEQGSQPHALYDVESFRELHVQIHERRRGERVAARRVGYGIAAGVNSLRKCIKTTCVESLEGRRVSALPLSLSASLFINL
jgi:hypothetical protein